MSADTTINRENLTLTDAELAACQPIAGEGGHVLRARCPFHGSDHQRSLRVTRGSGRFVCFACGAWGYLAEARERWQDARQRQAIYRRPPTRQRHQPSVSPRQPPPAVSPTPHTSAPAPPVLAEQLAVFQTALLGSHGETYLRQRGIPLALAQEHGVGYAAPGTWPHAARDWRGGRVVFPHTTPDGCLVNLYGRAVGTDAEVPKAKRHDHLPGEKGVFNAAALHTGDGPLWVCEGAFDALALLAAGVSRVVAIFGVQGWRWAWTRAVREIVFALDADAAGEQAWRALAREAALRGKCVAGLEPTAYGGYKDVNAAWMAGTLTIAGGPAVLPGPEGLEMAEDLGDAWAERAAIMQCDGGLARSVAEHAAWRCLTDASPP